MTNSEIDGRVYKTTLRKNKVAMDKICEKYQKFIG